MGTNTGRGGRKRLPPHLLAVIRKNSGLVHAIACEIIERQGGFVLSPDHEPRNLLVAFGDAVAEKLRHLKDETLGRIISVGRGTAPRDDSPTTMSEVHDGTAWLAGVGELSGRKLLEGIAVTVIVARMYDILDRDAARAEEKAA